MVYKYVTRQKCPAPSWNISLVNQLATSWIISLGYWLSISRQAAGAQLERIHCGFYTLPLVHYWARLMGVRVSSCVRLAIWFVYGAPILLDRSGEERRINVLALMTLR